MSDHQGSSARAILYALIANLGIAVTKAGAAVYTHSGSMLAEAIHSCADCANQVLLFVGLRQSARPATREHPLGYGKETYFWSFVVAMLLFGVGGLFSIYEGWHKLLRPQPLNQAWVALVVLGIAVLLETSSLLGALREIRKIRGDRRFRDWFRHTRNSELVVVLGEDIAALTGLALAFMFLTLAIVTGDTRWDAVGSIVIGLVLIFVATFIAARIRSLLIGRSAEPGLERSLRECIERDPGIDELLNAITLQFGPQVLLAVKVRMRPDLNIEEAVERINALEREIKATHPEVGWCFVEPDVTD